MSPGKSRGRCIAIKGSYTRFYFNKTISEYTKFGLVVVTIMVWLKCGNLIVKNEINLQALCKTIMSVILLYGRYHSLTITLIIIIPPETKFRGGILDSPCSSVRLSVCLSVRPSVRPWVGVRMITLILFSGFKKFFLHISLGSRSCMGFNISVLPH